MDEARELWEGGWVTYNVIPPEADRAQVTVPQSPLVSLQITGKSDIHLQEVPQVSVYRQKRIRFGGPLTFCLLRNSISIGLYGGKFRFLFTMAARIRTTTTTITETASSQKASLT